MYYAWVQYEGHNQTMTDSIRKAMKPIAYVGLQFDIFTFTCHLLFQSRNKKKLSEALIQTRKVLKEVSTTKVYKRAKA